MTKKTSAARVFREGTLLKEFEDVTDIRVAEGILRVMTPTMTAGYPLHAFTSFVTFEKETAE